MGASPARLAHPPVVELAEFGQTGDQNGGERGADSGNGGEAAAVFGECGAASNPAAICPSTALRCACKTLSSPGDFPRDPGLSSGARTVLLAPDAGYQVVAAGDEIGQPVPGRDRSARSVREERPAHPGEDFGIDPVGLGEVCRWRGRIRAPDAG